MKRLLLAMLLSATATAAYAGDYTIGKVDKVAMQHVIDKLKEDLVDPDSFVIRGKVTVFAEAGKGYTYYCFNYSAKNSYGGYAPISAHYAMVEPNLKSVLFTIDGASAVGMCGRMFDSVANSTGDIK